jgi:hypothetical protein
VNALPITDARKRDECVCRMFFVPEEDDVNLPRLTVNPSLLTVIALPVGVTDA